MNTPDKILVTKCMVEAAAGMLGALYIDISRMKTMGLTSVSDDEVALMLMVSENLKNDIVISEREST